jgi:hypothetical protein
MRLVLIATAAGVAMLFVGGVNATPESPFVGTWWAIDPSDQSLERATFGAGGSLSFSDDFASNPTCGGTTGHAKDVGTVSGDTWTGTGSSTFECAGSGDRDVPDVFFQFTLNPDGTLSSSIGDEVWTRSRP